MADTNPSPQHTYDFQITMTCTGCSGAVDRVLKKLDGIETYTVDLTSQTAHVETKPDSKLEYATVLEKIKKTGKTVRGGSRDGVSMDV